MGKLAPDVWVSIRGSGLLSLRPAGRGDLASSSRSGQDPGRAGRPLRGELEGLYSALRGEFRVIYEIDDDARVVLIHRAQHRRRVYRSA